MRLLETFVGVLVRAWPQATRVLRDCIRLIVDRVIEPDFGDTRLFAWRLIWTCARAAPGAIAKYTPFFRSKWGKVFDHHIALDADAKILKFLRENAVFSDDESEEEDNPEAASPAFAAAREAKTVEKMKRDFWTASSLMAYRCYVLGVIGFLRQPEGDLPAPAMNAIPTLLKQAVEICLRISIIEEFLKEMRSSLVAEGENLLERCAETNQRRREYHAKRVAEGRDEARVPAGSPYFKDLEDLMEFADARSEASDSSENLTSSGSLGSSDEDDTEDSAEAEDMTMDSSLEPEGEEYPVLTSDSENDEILSPPLNRHILAEDEETESRSEPDDEEAPIGFGEDWAVGANNDEEDDEEEEARDRAAEDSSGDDDETLSEEEANRAYEQMDNDFNVRPMRKIPPVSFADWSFMR